MKIKINKQPRGSALLVTMLTALIVGMALASYLTLVSVQNQSTLHSQSWNSAVPVMEAGVEEALTALYYYGTTNLANLVAQGWNLNSADAGRDHQLDQGHGLATGFTGCRCNCAVHNAIPMFSCRGCAGCCRIAS